MTSDLMAAVSANIDWLVNSAFVKPTIYAIINGKFTRTITKLSTNHCQKTNEVTISKHLSKNYQKLITIHFETNQ